MQQIDLKLAERKEATASFMGHVSAQIASDAADRKTGGAWSDSSWRFLLTWGPTTGPGGFLGEDLRHAAQGFVPIIKEQRAWGAVLLRAVRAGLIERIGYTAAKDRKSHGNPKSIWLWKRLP